MERKMRKSVFLLKKKKNTAKLNPSVIDGGFDSISRCFSNL